MKPLLVIHHQVIDVYTVARRIIPARKEIRRAGLHASLASFSVRRFPLSLRFLRDRTSVYFAPLTYCNVMFCAGYDIVLVLLLLLSVIISICKYWYS